MRVEVEGSHFGAPVNVHTHGGVADGHALEIKFSALDDGVLILEDLFCEGGKVHPGVGLAGDEEFVVLELWEFFEEGAEGVEVVHGCAGVVETL